MAHIWWGPVVFRWYSLPAAGLISGLFTSPALLRMRYTVDSDTENPMFHLERGDKIDAHDCPCWRVAYAQGVQLVDVGEQPRVLELQEFLYLEREGWEQEREHLHAARRLVSRDVAELQQEIETLQLERTARRGIRGSPGFPRRSSLYERWTPHPEQAGLVGLTSAPQFYGYSIDVDGYPVYVVVGEPEGVTGEAYDPGAEFLVNGQLMIKISKGSVVDSRVFKVLPWDKPQVVPLEYRLPFFPGPKVQAASEESTEGVCRVSQCATFAGCQQWR